MKPSAYARALVFRRNASPRTRCPCGRPHASQADARSRRPISAPPTRGIRAMPRTSTRSHLLCRTRANCEAASILKRGIDLHPDDVNLAHNLARLLATATDPGARRTHSALQLATAVNERTRSQRSSAYSRHALRRHMQQAVKTIVRETADRAAACAPSAWRPRTVAGNRGAHARAYAETATQARTQAMTSHASRRAFVLLALVLKRSDVASRTGRASLIRTSCSSPSIRYEPIMLAAMVTAPRQRRRSMASPSVAFASTAR